MSLLSDKANYSIDVLNKWFIANKLSLNLAKTCYIVFPHKYQDHIEIVVDSLEIQKVSTCKYLDVTLDNELKRNVHIDHIYQKLIKFTSLFYKLRAKLPRSILQNIYFAFVHPHILYGIELYANTYSCHVDKLNKLNNKILRIIQNKPLSTHVLELYSNFNTLPIKDLHMQQLLILVHKCMHHLETLPNVFANYFTINKYVHDFNTRRRDDIHMYCCNLSLGLRCTGARAGSLWNSLPNNMKVYMSVRVFKIKLHNYLLSLK